MKILVPELDDGQPILVQGMCDDLYFWNPTSGNNNELIQEIRKISKYIQGGESGIYINIYIIVDIETFERIKELGRKWVERPIQGVKVNIYEGLFGTITFIHPKSLTTFLNNYESN